MVKALSDKGLKYEEWVDSLSCQTFETMSREILENPQKGKLLHAAIGLAGESGELIDTVKKHLIYGKELDVENAKEELGDILFFAAMAANALGVSLEEIAESNFAKLSKRYPNGTFSREDAIQRLDKK